MPRVEPGRWLNVAVVVLSFTALGPALAYRFGGGQQVSGETLVLGAQIGGAVGIGAGLIALLVFAVNDSRRIAVAQRLPHAYVVQAEKNRSLVDALDQVQPGIRVQGTTVSVAFDTEGVSFWVGSGQPEGLLFVPASQVRDVTLGEPLKPANTRGKTVARLSVVIETPSGAVDVPMVLRRTQGIGTGFENMNQAQVAVAVRLANERRGGASSRGSSAPYFAFADDRVHGVTAWTLLRRVRLYVVVFIVLLHVSIFGLVWLFLQTDEVLLSLLAWIASVVVLYAPVKILRRALERARTRERAAGYTTLNGLDLDLRQLQPLTGRVIRTAGAPALSRDEFKRALSMA